MWYVWMISVKAYCLGNRNRGGLIVVEELTKVGEELREEGGVEIAVWLYK